MRQLVANDDLKRLLQGVSAACASGLLLGAAMQPDLTADAIKGPQQLVAGGGPRSYAAANEAGVGAYGATPPEYVIGTDWTRPHPILADAPQAAPYDDDTVELAADDDPPPLQVTHADWRDLPPLPRNYPTLDGPRAYEDDPPPAPPGADDY